MFQFFRISVFTAVFSLFLLGSIALSDIFIHANQFRFYVLTIMIAAIFLGIGLTGISVYKNVRTIYLYVSENPEPNLAQKAVRKLALIFGFIAIVITLFTWLLCVGFLERMLDGTALLG